jgi:hypothetical protein
LQKVNVRDDSPAHEQIGLMAGRYVADVSLIGDAKVPVVKSLVERMKNMTVKFLFSKIMLPLITFVIGLILGISLFYAYGKDYLLLMTGLQPVKYIIWESEEAVEPYLNGNKEVARYALEHSAKILEHFSKDKEVNSWGATTDLAITYARLGKLAETEGDKKRAGALFSKAAVTYSKQMKTGSCTPDKIRKIVDKLDSAKFERTFPTFASVFTSTPTPPNQPLEPVR